MVHKSISGKVKYSHTMSIIMVSFDKQFNSTFTEHTWGPGCRLGYTAACKDERHSQQSCTWSRSSVFMEYLIQKISQPGLPWSGRITMWDAGTREEGQELAWSRKNWHWRTRDTEIRGQESPAVSTSQRLMSPVVFSHLATGCPSNKYSFFAPASLTWVIITLTKRILTNQGTHSFCSFKNIAKQFKSLPHNPFKFNSLRI